MNKKNIIFLILCSILLVFFFFSCAPKELPESAESPKKQVIVSETTRTTSKPSDTAIPNESLKDLTGSKNDEDNAKMIALEVMTADYKYSNIILVNSTGEFISKITDDSFNNFAPELSPDGKKIAFYSNRDGDYDIYTVNADGTDLKNITNNDFGDFMPKWSSDGKKICYYSDEAGYTDVYIINFDGTEKTQIVKNNAENSGAIWSADNRGLIYVSNEEGNFDIYSIGIDGNKKTKLTNDEYFEETLSLSPDGSKVLYSAGQIDNTVFEVFVLDLNTLKTSQVTNNMSYGRMPLWAEEGNKIIFSSDMKGYSEIYIMNSDGSGIKNLTNNDIDDYLINISSDGYDIFYQAFKEDSGTEVLMYDLKSSNIIKILADLEDIKAEFEILRTIESDPIKIFAFIDKNIEFAGIEFADEMIDSVLQFSESELYPFGDRYADAEIQQKLWTDFNGSIDLETLKNADDEMVSKLAKETIYRRYKLEENEGFISPIIDYESYKSYGKYLSQQMNSFIEIMAFESESPSVMDAGIVIPLDDFADRIMKLYDFEEKYPGFIRIYYIVNMLNGKLWVYMGGIDNTPVFDFGSNTIIGERLTDFKAKAEKYKGTRFGDKLTEYLELLKTENYMKTQKVADYIDNLTFY